MERKGRLIIISAPSGAGKTTVIRHFLSRNPNMVHSISWTTRPMRPGETQDAYYHHTDRQTFEAGIKEGKFAEWNEVHNNLYGTPKGPLEEALEKGRDILLDLDVIGGLKLKEIYKDRAISIFLLPPSLDELKKRLSARKTDSEEEQEIRLKNALKEMTYKDKFDYRVTNDVLERACEEIEEILRSKE